MLNEDSGILVNHGEGSPAGTTSTIPGLLLHSAEQYRKLDTFKFKKNGHWVNVSTDEFLRRVEAVFFALRRLGLKRADRVAIVSENCLEWAVADYAALAAGAITVPLYPTLSAAQTRALLQDCAPAIIFVSNSNLLDKVLPARRGLPGCHIVTFASCIELPGVTRLDCLEEMGQESIRSYPAEFRSTAGIIDADDVATIIYTSGTTGVPKGAMLTHRNLVSNVMATSERLPLSSGDLSLSFLPLSHIFQRHVDYATVFGGASIAYTEGVSNVIEDMLDVRPTFAAGVPRFFERVYSRIQSEIARTSPAIGHTIFEAALRVTERNMRRGQMSLVGRLADRLIFQRIRRGLGGRLRFFISGGATLGSEIARFFWAIGLPVYEGYGLTETSPVITLNGPGMVRLGTVGRIVGDQEIRIAEDGEILVRGSNVMAGYYRMDRETSEALTGGWFHTGDIGTIDADGFLTITDRKKDLIITSSGKNIAPQAIENRLKSIPLFESAVVVGDGRSFVSALIVPNFQALATYARSHHIRFEDPRTLIRNREIYEFAMAEIARRTEDLSPFEKIRKIAFLEQEFSIDGGELTPTMKVRRSAVEKKYKSVIDQLYTS